MFLAKNSDYRGDIPLSISVGMRSSSKANFSSQRQWADTEVGVECQGSRLRLKSNLSLQDVHELVEAISNWDLVIFHLRPWSFESRAVLRAFHSVR